MPNHFDDDTSMLHAYDVFMHVFKVFLYLPVNDEPIDIGSH